MKNAILAFLGVFAFSTAFACGSAPPVPVQVEVSISMSDCVASDYVFVDTADNAIIVPPVDQVQLFNSAPAVIIFKPGFFYRNVDYENQDKLVFSNTVERKKNYNIPGISNSRYPDKKKSRDTVPRCLV